MEYVIAPSPTEPSKTASQSLSVFKIRKGWHLNGQESMPTQLLGIWELGIRILADTCLSPAVPRSVKRVTWCSNSELTWASCTVVGDTLSSCTCDPSQPHHQMLLVAFQC